MPIRWLTSPPTMTSLLPISAHRTHDHITRTKGTDKGTHTIHNHATINSEYFILNRFGCGSVKLDHRCSRLSPLTPSAAFLGREETCLHNAQPVAPLYQPADPPLHPQTIYHTSPYHSRCIARTQTQGLKWIVPRCYWLWYGHWYNKDDTWPDKPNCNGGQRCVSTKQPQQQPSAAAAAAVAAASNTIGGDISIFPMTRPPPPPPQHHHHHHHPSLPNHPTLTPHLKLNTQIIQIDRL